MKNRDKFQIILTTLVCLLPMLLAAVLYDKLPDRIPIHFDINGNANGYASKAAAGFIMPPVFAALNLFVIFMLNTDPKRKNANPVMRVVGIWTVPVLSFILIPMSLLKGMGYRVPIVKIITAILGLLFIIMGNYMPKSRQTYTIGIRLPWTLDNEENWNRTHRFAGYIWVVGGFGVIVGAFVGSKYLMLSVLVLLIVLPALYSFLLYRKQKRGE